MSAALDFAALEDLVTVLRAAEVRATTDVSEVGGLMPCAWVTCEGFQTANLAGSLTLLAAVWLVVPDSDAARAYAALAALYNQVCPVPVTPDGARELRTLQLPDGTQAPAIRVPLHLSITA